MNSAMRIVALAAGLFALFMAVALFSFFGGFQGVLLRERLFSGTSPIGVLAVFGILIFGGAYFFNAAGHIIKGAVK